jgi:hypothetical protein
LAIIEGHPAPIGTSSAALYEFCSYIPQQPSAFGPFQPSSQRLSESYALFLSALAPSQQVSLAQAALDAPANQTQVQYPNGAMKMPTWIATEDAQAFVASVSGKPGLGSTIRVDLSGGDDSSPSGPTLFSVSRPGGENVPIRLAAGEVRQLELRADAWGDIPLHPAAWFNGSLVRLFSGGPFVSGFTSDKFFGSNGILRGLLTGLRVGLNVSVVATVSDAAAAELQKAAPAGAAIRVAGLGFAAESVGATEANGISQLNLPSVAALSPAGLPIPASTPVIVGVDVAALP